MISFTVSSISFNKNDDRFGIHFLENGEVDIDGDIGNVALELVKYIFDFNSGEHSTIKFGNVAQIDVYDNKIIKLQYLLQNEPENFKKLSKEIDRVLELKMFL